MAGAFLINFLRFLVFALWLLILARVLLSWVDPFGNMRITQILRDVTEPILAPIRSVLPGMAMFDFSPIIAMVQIRTAFEKTLSGTAISNRKTIFHPGAFIIITERITMATISSWNVRASAIIEYFSQTT